MTAPISYTLLMYSREFDPTAPKEMCIPFSVIYSQNGSTVNIRSIDYSKAKNELGRRLTDAEAANVHATALRILSSHAVRMEAQKYWL